MSHVSFMLEELLRRALLLYCVCHQHNINAERPQRKGWREVLMPSILVVDEEPKLLFSLQKLLARNDHRVLAAESGSEGLKQLLASSPDLVLAGSKMQDMEGKAFCRRVRALTGGSVPLLVLTSNGSIEDKLAYLRDGADDYMSHPFDPQELLARVEAILSRVDQSRASERADLDAVRSRTLSRLASQLSAPVQELSEHLDNLSTARLIGDQAAQRTSLRSAIELAHTLSELVDDLEWASAGHVDHSLPREPVRIAPIVRRAAASAARQAVPKNVRLNITCGGLLSGMVNEGAIIRSLASLLEAVIELAPTDGQVSIMARRAPDRGLEFVITEGHVASNGHGRPENLDDALRLTRHVALGHHGKFDIEQLRDGRHSYVLWVPGRSPGASRVA
jgi:DNA-binding response OmpR family regulator